MIKLFLLTLFCVAVLADNPMDKAMDMAKTMMEPARAMFDAANSAFGGMMDQATSVFGGQSLVRRAAQDSMNPPQGGPPMPPMPPRQQ